MGATSSAELARMEAEREAFARAHLTFAQSLVAGVPSSRVSAVEKSHMLATMEWDSLVVTMVMKNQSVDGLVILIKMFTENVQPGWPLAKHHYTGAVRSTPNDKTTGDEAVSAAAAAAPTASVSAAAAPSHPQPPSPPLGAEPKPAADSSSRASAETSGGAADEDEYEEDSNDEHVPLLTNKTQ